MKMKSALVSGAAIAAAAALTFGGFALANELGDPAPDTAATVVETTDPTPTPEATAMNESSPATTTESASTPIVEPTPTSAPAAPVTEPAPEVTTETEVTPTPTPRPVKHFWPTYTPADPQPANTPDGWLAANVGEPYDPITNPNPKYVWYRGCVEGVDTSCETSGLWYADGYK